MTAIYRIFKDPDLFEYRKTSGKRQRSQCSAPASSKKSYKSTKLQRRSANRTLLSSRRDVATIAHSANRSDESSEHMPIPYVSVSSKEHASSSKREVIFCPEATFEQISEMTSKMMNSPTTKFDLVFSDCSLRAEHLKFFFSKLQDQELEITTLEISYLDSVNDLLEEIFLLVKKYQTRSLTLEFDELDDESIKKMSNYLADEKFRTSLESLDISYNNNISPVGYKQIGEILYTSSIVSFKAMSCCISDEKLVNLFTGMKNGKLKVLNISNNAELTAKGMRIIARFVVDNKGIQTLNLSGCEISQDTLAAFYKVLPQPRPDSLIEELDVSYNSTIGISASLGRVVVNYGITKLNLAGCNLNRTTLSSLRKVTKDHKINTVNMRDNTSIGGSFCEIVQFVIQCEIKELNLFDCWLSAFDLRDFTEKLKMTKFSCLHVGDREREPDANYIEEICNLLKNVDVLYLQFYDLSNDLCLRLRSTGRNRSTKIILNGKECN